MSPEQIQADRQTDGQTDPTCWFQDESWYPSVTWAVDRWHITERCRSPCQFTCDTFWGSIGFVHRLKAMENFWMYQVEKLEEEQAKQQQKQPKDLHHGVEVWTVWGVLNDFSICVLMVYICSGGGIVLLQSVVIRLDETIYFKTLVWIHNRVSCFIPIFWKSV